MGNDSTKANTNVYFLARKQAAKYDERLCSRESAADLIGVSSSSLADYELGQTKVVPVDKVAIMAEVYHAPQLKTLYCKHECPIGKLLAVSTEVKTIERVTLGLLGQLDLRKLEDIKKTLIDVSLNEREDLDELKELQEIRLYFDKLQEKISELTLLCDKREADSKW